MKGTQWDPQGLILSQGRSLETHPANSKQLVHSAVWPPGWGCRLGACRQRPLRRCPGSVILVREAWGVSFFLLDLRFSHLLDKRNFSPVYSPPLPTYLPTGWYWGVFFFADWLC